MGIFNPYGTVRIGTNVTEFPTTQTNRAVELRCKVAVDFLKMLVADGPWVLDSPGTSKVSGSAAMFTAQTEMDMRAFMMARILLNRPVGLLLPKADTFVKGSVIPLDAMGRCSVLCVEVEGHPVECRIQSERWPESSATLMMPDGLIFLWWLHTNTDWKTARHTAEIIAAGFQKGNATNVCMLPGVTPGVQIIDVGTDAYYLDEFSRRQNSEPDYVQDMVPSGVMPNQGPPIAQSDHGHDRQHVDRRNVDLRVSAKTLRG